MKKGIFKEKKLILCCPGCGNENLIDWFDGYYCRKCDLVYSYGDLDCVGVETGETYEVEYEEDNCCND
ncbi:hypothetical protein ACSW8L_16395 (plasmid) [Clostridium perfringens]